jgi:hypothetical protein
MQLFERIKARPLKAASVVAPPDAPSVTAQENAPRHLPRSAALRMGGVKKG